MSTSPDTSSRRKPTSSSFENSSAEREAATVAMEGDSSVILVEANPLPPTPPHQQKPEDSEHRDHDAEQPRALVGGHHLLGDADGELRG